MPEIPAELAEKVLTADLRNIVQKSSGGKVLTAGERKIIQDLTDAGTSVEELLEQRSSALLKKWVGGGRLNDEEMVEAGILLPNAQAIARKQTKQTYPKPLAHYGRVFDTTPRTIKRWIEKGRSADDMPPLDDPLAMASWWGKNMKQRVPDKLLALAKPKTEEKESPAVAPNLDRQKAEEALAEMGSGYAAALERARSNEKLAASLLVEAQREQPPDEGKIEMRQRAWDRAFDSLRKAEKDAESVLLASGDLVRWSEKEQELMEQLNAIHQGLRSTPVRVATKLGISGDLFKEMTETWHAELDRVFEAMQNADFGPAFELEPAA